MSTCLRRVPWAAAAAAGLLLSAVQLSAAAQAPDTPPPLGPPAPLILPTVIVTRLSNGLRLVVLPDHRQPALWLRLSVPAGSVRDPRSRAGLAQMEAALLDKGTAARTEPEIAEQIDGMGASLDASADADYLTVSAQGLSPFADRLFDLLSDVALSPVFPLGEVERERKQMLSGLDISLSDPATLAGAAIDRRIYGAHPYGNFAQGTPQTIRSITRAELVRFHTRYVVPHGATLLVMGDISAADAAAEARRWFGRWSAAPAPAPPAVPAPISQGSRITLIDRPGAAQTEVRIGQRSGPYRSPNRIPGLVATAVLGMGQFEGRLTKEIRVKRGLTYDVASYFNRRKLAGGFLIATFTKTASTGEVIQLALQQAGELARQEVGPAELHDRKTFLTGSFAVGVSTPEGLLGRLSTAVLYGRGPQDLTDFTNKVMAVTPAQVEGVMQRLRLDSAPIVLVGDAQAVQPQLAGLGSVSVITPGSLDLLSPDLELPKQRASAPSGQIERAPLLAAIQAAGGDAFLHLRSVTLKGAGDIAPPGRQTDQLIPVDSMVAQFAAPDKMRLDMSTGFGDVAVGVPGSGEAPWLLLKGAGTVRRINPEAAATLVISVDPLYLLQQAAAQNFAVTAAPQATGALAGLDAGQLTAFRITDVQGRQRTLYADRASGLIRRMVAPSSAGDVIVSLEKYKSVSGVELPMKVKVERNGNTLAEFTFSSAEVNQPLNPKLFAVPSTH